MENRPKMDQKSIKNPPKIDLGGVLERLGASWTIWAASAYHRRGLGPLLGVLGSSPGLSKIAA